MQVGLEYASSKIILHKNPITSSIAVHDPSTPLSNTICRREAQKKKEEKNTEPH